jgi:hypothetical protein
MHRERDVISSDGYGTTTMQPHPHPNSRSGGPLSCGKISLRRRARLKRRIVAGKSDKQAVALGVDQTPAVRLHVPHDKLGLKLDQRREHLRADLPQQLGAALDIREQKRHIPGRKLPISNLVRATQSGGSTP